MSLFHNLRVFASRSKGIVSATVSCDLASTGLKGFVADWYPGGQIVYVVDPGVAQVFIAVTGSGGADVLTPWTGDVQFKDDLHDRLEVFVNGQSKLIVPVLDDEPSQYVVWRDLNLPGCWITPADAIVPATRFRVFGPATLAQCELWKSKFCSFEFPKFYPPIKLRPEWPPRPTPPFPIDPSDPVDPVNPGLLKFLASPSETVARLGLRLRSNFSPGQTLVALVRAVTDVSFQRSLPPILLVQAEGQSNTGGWSNISLVPRESSPGPDAIAKFDLVGIPPSGIATQVFTTVRATGAMPLREHETVRGIFIRASSNSILVFQDPQGGWLPPVDGAAFRELEGEFGEGVECPTLTTDDGKLHTLLIERGSEAYAPGTRIRLTGLAVEFAICQQGIETISVLWHVAA
ncbi:MAG: hypothetical protein ACK52Z_09755 [Acidobacteriota bacterium]